MHSITRKLSHGDPNKKAAFESQFKDMVWESITTVLATERSNDGQGIPGSTQE